MPTYICSDIHGAYNKFQQLLKEINFNDSDIMYILGDVIDRGKESILLLQDIMQRKNVTLLLGNHEYMMVKTLSGSSHSLKLWQRNGGRNTYEDFLKLPYWEQEIIFDYLIHLPIVIPNVVVGKRKYYLAHASYSTNPDISEKDNMQTMSDDDIENIIWARDYPFIDITKTLAYKKHSGKILIAGHTITKNNKIFHGCKGHYIDMDCGCALYARGNEKGKLGCLCLEGLKEYYI